MNKTTRSVAACLVFAALPVLGAGGGGGGGGAAANRQRRRMPILTIARAWPR